MQLTAFFFALWLVSYAWIDLGAGPFTWGPRDTPAHTVKTEYHLPRPQVHLFSEGKRTSLISHLQEVCKRREGVTLLLLFCVLVVLLLAAFAGRSPDSVSFHILQMVVCVAHQSSLCALLWQHKMKSGICSLPSLQEDCAGLICFVSTFSTFFRS